MSFEEQQTRFQGSDRKLQIIHWDGIILFEVTFPIQRHCMLMMLCVGYCATYRRMCRYKSRIVLSNCNVLLVVT